MKKALSVSVFLFMVFSAFAQTPDNAAMKQECRKIIYAVKPVEAVRKLDDETLRRLYIYAMGSKGQDRLNENDQIMAFSLFSLELDRRTMSPDDFSLSLQEMHESLVPYIKGRGDTTPYIKVDGWIDLFKLDLMFAN